MAAPNDHHRYSERNLVRTESFDKKLNRSLNHRLIVSPSLTLMDRIPNDVRWTEQPSMKRPKRRIETEKDEGAGGGDKAWNSKKQSSRSLFPSSSFKQEELRKIYGRRTERNVKETSSSEQDSESSEEEEGISEEEFKKTEIWKQFKEALMMHTLSAKTQPKSSLPLAYSF